MKKSIRDFDLNGKKVLIRCDFNVPISDGVIVDDNRIVESLDTIRFAIKNGAKVILLSHLGKIKTLEDKKNKSLKIVSERLSKLLSIDVKFIDETRGKKLESAIFQMKPKDVILIENTRFEDYPDKLESSNDYLLGKYWASLGDIFINDAFATSHRAHASNVGIASHLPNGVGFLVEKELKALSFLENPSHPYMVILGGAKISDKIEIVSSLVKKADYVLIGGGMAYTFLKAKGFNIGKSIFDEDSLDFAHSILKEYSDKIVLPIDSKVAETFDDNDKYSILKNENMGSSGIGLDIGPDTIKQFKEYLKDAKTIFWNGTLGYSEFKNYSDGTSSILEFITSLNATVILGGGDTVAASKKFGYKDKVSYASTGGGATLEYICGKKLPGIDLLEEENL